MHRLVVIGGDAAGMSAASQARKRRGPDELQIVAFERGRATSYSACGIPYWISGAVEREEQLVTRTPEAHRRNHIDVRTRTEVVERLGVLAAAVEVAGPHGAGGQVDPDHLRAGADVDVVAAVRFGRPRDELLLALDGPADPVRDTARGVGGGAPPLERDDLQLVGPAPLARLARGAHARRVAPDHHQPVHGTNLRCCRDL